MTSGSGDYATSSSIASTNPLRVRIGDRLKSEGLDNARQFCRERGVKIVLKDVYQKCNKQVFWFSIVEFQDIETEVFYPHFFLQVNERDTCVKLARNVAGQILWRVLQEMTEPGYVMPANDLPMLHGAILGRLLGYASFKMEALESRFVQNLCQPGRQRVSNM